MAVSSVLSSFKGLNLTNDACASFATDVAALQQRLLCGEETAFGTLMDALQNHHTSENLTNMDEVGTCVREAVNSVKMIEKRTNRFPPSHCNFML